MNFKVKVLPVLMIALLYCSCNKKVNTANTVTKEQHNEKSAIRDTTGLWNELVLTAAMEGDGTIKPDKFRPLLLDFEKMKFVLSQVSNERDKAQRPGSVINIPMPEGNYELFRIYETQIMAPELAAKFPDIRTYGGNGVFDKTLSISMDINRGGFHAMILSQKGAINIDPYSRNNNTRYICYYKQDYNPAPRERMEVDSIK